MEFFDKRDGKSRAFCHLELVYFRVLLHGGLRRGIRYVWVQVPQNKTELEWVRSRLRKRFGVDELNKLRLELDPKNILGNELVDALLPRIDVNPLAIDATEILA